MLVEEIKEQKEKIMDAYIELALEHTLLLNGVQDSLLYVCDFMQKEGDYCERHCTVGRRPKDCFGYYAKIVLERRKHED